jgi:hypothetical protein
MSDARDGVAAEMAKIAQAIIAGMRIDFDIRPRIFCGIGTQESARDPMTVWRSTPSLLAFSALLAHQMMLRCSKGNAGSHQPS